MDALDDIERKQRGDRAAVRSDAEAFEAMMKSPAWKRYVALVEAVAQNYHGAIMKPLETVHEVTKMEFAKGVLSGLSLATSLPAMKIKEAGELHGGDEDDAR
jgi:hypothetical protein